MGGRGQCYAIPARLEVEASDAVITGIIPICFRPSSALFDPTSTFSYVSVYFALGFDSISEPLAMPIRVSTPVDDCVVARRVYKGCVVSIRGRETFVDLSKLDMLDFDVILRIDWFNLCYAPLDY